MTTAKPSVNPSLNRADYDDWEECYNGWTKARMCHCGFISNPGADNLCPRCGCLDSFELKVVREEFEVSPGLRKAYFGSEVSGYSFGQDPPYIRNKRFVEWTGCNHERR